MIHGVFSIKCDQCGDRENLEACSEISATWEAEKAGWLVIDFIRHGSSCPKCAKRYTNEKEKETA